MLSADNVQAEAIAGRLSCRDMMGLVATTMLTPSLSEAGIVMVAEPPPFVSPAVNVLVACAQRAD